MTDHDFERRLRDWFREEVDQTQAAPVALRQQPDRHRERRPATPRSVARRWMLLAAAALIAMLVAGLAAVGSRLIRQPAPFPACALA